jgi:DDE superfamily endonuclease
MVMDDPRTGEAIIAYVEQALVPELWHGDTFIMDSLLPHKVHGVRQAIEAVGASLRYLRPYNPDFNPVEMAFAKLKLSCAPPLPVQSQASREPSPTPFAALSPRMRLHRAGLGAPP